MWEAGEPPLLFDLSKSGKEVVETNVLRYFFLNLYYILSDAIVFSNQRWIKL